jgi:hypothetical protein
LGEVQRRTPDQRPLPAANGGLREQAPALPFILLLEFIAVFPKGKEVRRMTRKHRRQKAVSAYDVALAACEALVPTPVRPKPDVRRAMVLAKFAVAMTK